MDNNDINFFNDFDPFLTNYYRLWSIIIDYIDKKILGL